MTVDKELLNSIKITPLIDTLKLEDIDDDIYFSEKYKNYISNSRLGLLKSKGVQAFFDGIKSDYNPSFALGTALHELVLQPESFELIDSVFKPTAKAGLMADYLYNPNGVPPTDDDIKSASYKIGYYKDKLTPNRLTEFKIKADPYWRDRYLYEQKNPLTDKSKERIYTDEKSVEILKCCLESLQEDKNIQSLLHPLEVVTTPYIANERTILLDIQADIEGYESKVYHIKAKLDNFTIEDDLLTVNDLKTTSRLAKDFDLEYFSYQRELAGYSWLLKLAAKKFFNIENPKIKGNFLVVSTVPNYNTMVYPMTDKLFKSGWNEYVYLLKVVIYYNIVKGYDL